MPVRMQLTDEWVEENFPESGRVAGAREKLIEAAKFRSEAETQDRVRMALTAEISNLVDCEIPEFMVEEVAKNEFQAKLMEVGQKVRQAA